jgi:hypothetical protein
MCKIIHVPEIQRNEKNIPLASQCLKDYDENFLYGIVAAYA